MNTNPNDQEIKLEFALDVEDFLALNNYNVQKILPKRRTNKKVLGLICASIVLIGGIARIIMANYPDTTGIHGTFLGVFFTVFGLLLLLMLLFSRKLLSSLLEFNIKNQYSLSLGTHKFLVSAQGISDETESVSTTFKWTAIKEIAQTDQHFFLVITPRRAIIIPKRAFPDASQAERFIENVNKMLQQTITVTRAQPSVI